MTFNGATIERGIRILAVAAAALSAAACASYPSEPRYSIYAPANPAASPYAATNTPSGYPDETAAYPPPATTYEAPPPATAPIGEIDGGALPPASGGYETMTPASPAPAYAAPPATSTVTAGAAYVIQPGDTISGVGRRFQTPVQTLIDLNGLGPRGTISAGQNVILPDSAVDTGRDPYATGTAPIGVQVPQNGVIPPPPPPPSGNPAAPPPARTPLVGGPVAATTPATRSTVTLQWPVRGDIVRRFGPVGLGERNNGINIGASAGAPVNASAAGRVAYVGDDLVGQGLTVLMVHPDGWRTVYGHLGSATVDDGAEVRQGQQIGTVGLTAGDGRPSIHFETRRMQGDDPVAIDPLTVLPR